MATFWPMTLNGCVMRQPLGHFLARQLVAICPSLRSPAEVLLWQFGKRLRKQASHSKKLPAGIPEQGGPILALRALGRNQSFCCLVAGIWTKLYTAALLPNSCIQKEAIGQARPSGDSWCTGKAQMKMAGLFPACPRPASFR